MKSHAVWTPGSLELTFVPESADTTVRSGASLARESVRFALPEGLDADGIHPDLEALAALLIVEPFTSQLTVTRPVSTAFAATVASALGCELGPVDPELAVRARPDGGVPAVALGTGFAITALSVLPANTVPIFARRTAPVGELVNTRYRDDVAVDASRHLVDDFGYNVQVVETDLEYLRDPIGFTTDWANGVPAVLLADRLSIDAVAWGVVLESAYRIGKGAFTEWSRRRVRRAWATVLAAAGLDFLDPIAGISEVAATTVLNASPLGRYEQTCVRGSVDAPCLTCWRCFRHVLVGSAAHGEWPGVADLHELFHVREIQRELAAQPIAGENVLAWATSRYHGQSRLMALLRDRACVDGQTVDWLERRYRPAAALLPTRYTTGIVAALDAVLQPMTPADERAMRAWDAPVRASQRRARRAGDQLARATGFAPSPTNTIGGWFDRALGR